MTDIVDALHGRKEGRSFRGDCPVCGANDFVITPPRDSNIVNPLVYCWHGCAGEDVIQALTEQGLWTTAEQNGTVSRKRRAVAPDTFPPSEHTSTHASQKPDVSKPPAAIYQFRWNNGDDPVAEKGRWETPDGAKTFRWRGYGKTDWKGLPRPLKEKDVPLYRTEDLENLAADVPVWFVEGEKCADALVGAGYAAVSAGGGAGQSEFGEGLTILRDRAVILWPDNDSDGRKFMHEVAKQIEPQVSQLEIVRPVVSKKGDAVDFLAEGGDVEELEVAPYTTQPTVEALEGDDNFRCRIPLAEGAILIDGRDMRQNPQRIDCDFVTRVSAPGSKKDIFSGRLNLLSLSNRELYRRQLDAMFGKEFGWTAHINIATSMIRNAYLMSDDAVQLADVDPVVAHRGFLVAPFLPAHQPSIFFGDGEAGKTFQAYLLALCVAHKMAYLKFDVPAEHGRVMIVDYETDKETAKVRLLRLLKGLSLGWPQDRLIYWGARGISLPAQKEAIKRRVLEDDVRLLVIDSAAAACGEPRNEQEVLAYFNALAYIGVTSLTIAHVSHGDGTQRQRYKPFGSVFWHNAARSTWYVTRVQGGGADMEVGLINRKMSNGPRHKPLAVTMKFDDSDPLGSIRVETASGDDVPEIRNELPLPQRFMTLLRVGERVGRTEPHTTEELCAQSWVSEDAGKRVLTGLERKGEIHSAGDGLWELPAP